MSDMSRKILVVGLQPHDAGKTTLCRALIHGFNKAGLTIVPFKPHSGIGYWNQFDAFQESLAKSTLLCSDIVELEAAAKSQIPLEILNPVNRLSNPVADRGIPEEKLAFQEFVAQRFTHHDGGNCRNIYYLNGTTNINRMRGMRDFFVAIKKNAQKVVFIRNFQQLVKAYVDNFEEATGSCYQCLHGKPLVVESFNDAAYPFSRAEDCNIVLCVSSRMILRFKAREYFKAIELRGQQKPKVQLTTADVYSSSLVERKYELQPLTNDERKDPAKLADNYLEIVDDLTFDFES